MGITTTFKKTLRMAVFSLCLFTAANGQITNPSEKKISCAATELPYPRPEPDYNAKNKRDFAPFTDAMKKFAPKAAAIDALLKGKTIPEIQHLIKDRKLDSETLVLYYLNRIVRYDVNLLNSVMELNPDALTIAREIDQERKTGKNAGMMFGIPVLVKDNIATADKMHTTAGAEAMSSWKPEQDAFLVSQLRKAGAIIMGKANLSEWANYMDPCMPSGFSVKGGQTRNPYGPYDTWGSSSGSAVSVAADLVTVSVGSETQGSIIMPGGINSVVALKTSMGLVSRSNIIPLLAFQDVPGPMGRNVTDVATLLTALSGVDENDGETKNAESLINTDFTVFAKPGTANGIRVGVPLMSDQEIQDYLAKVLAGRPASDVEKYSLMLKARRDVKKAEAQILIHAGVTVVEIPTPEMPARLDVGKLLEYGFKTDLNSFLANLGTNAPQPNLAAIIAFNKQDLANRAPYGQSFLEKSQNTSITQEQFDAIRTENFTKARAGIDSLLKKYNVDVLMDDVNQNYAPAGYPAIEVPSGYDKKGSPTWTTFVGPYLAEPKLIAVAYAYEQQAKARKTADLEAVTKLIQAIKK